MEVRLGYADAYSQHDAIEIVLTAVTATVGRHCSIEALYVYLYRANQQYAFIVQKAASTLLWSVEMLLHRPHPISPQSCTSTA